MLNNYRAEIISVGTELLLGQIANTDAQYISIGLAEIGIPVYFHSVAGDNAARVSELLLIASKRSNIIILTGGLGPTEDDLTKETLCEFLSLETQMHDESYKKLLEYFERIKKPMLRSNIKQVMFPENAVVLQNDYGTAPGMCVEKDGIEYYLFPGPPKELKSMFDNYAMPILKNKAHEVFKSRVLRIYGIGESAMAEKVSDLLQKQTNPTIAPLLGNGDVTLRITASAACEENAKALIEPVEKELCERLKEYVYGRDDDTLEKVFVEELKKRKLTVACAESCTGGLISSRITDVPGSSAVFMQGRVTYSNEAKVKLLGVKRSTLKKYGAVSEEVASQMAKGLRKRAKTDVAIAVTGIAGPDGGSQEKPVGLVYIGIAFGSKCVVHKCMLSGNREKVKFSTASSAINFARLMVSEDRNI